MGMDGDGSGKFTEVAQTDECEGDFQVWNPQGNKIRLLNFKVVTMVGGGLVSGAESGAFRGDELFVCAVSHHPAPAIKLIVFSAPESSKVGILVSATKKLDVPIVGAGAQL